MRNIICLISLLVLLGSCRDPYNPELRPGQTNFLVVEGLISPGDSTTRIRLSRTVGLNDSVRLRPEVGAQLWVEAEDNTRYPLVALDGGEYVAPRLQLADSRKYRLRIATADGKLYASGFQQVQQTPAVQVGWSRSPEGVQISLSARNAQNGNRFYKWDYDETWEIRSLYTASFKYVNGSITPRNQAEIGQMSLCWARNRTSTVKLINTTPLSENFIDREPVLFIPQGDEKLTVKYSVRVQLHVLDQQGYNFFQLMKKNTESLGTLFDPQPSEIPGNVQCLTDPQEKVIGYIAVSQVQEQRIFITKDELPDWNYLSGCSGIKVAPTVDELKIFQGDAFIPHGFEGFMPITAWLGVARPCADCRTRGNNTRPDFW